MAKGEMLRRMEAMASPARLEIIDVLEREGPLSMRELADVLGRRADGLYYHMRELIAAGVVTEVAQRDVHGARFDVTERPLQLDYSPADPANRRAVIAIVKAVLRNAERRFAKAFVPVKKDSRARSLWTGRAQGRLNERDLREVNQHIDEILRIVQSARGRQDNNAAMHDFTFVICPIER